MARYLSPWVSGMEIRPDSYDYEIMREQPRAYGELVPFITDSVVLDIGAHVGFFARWVVSHNPQMIYSYEPEPNNFAQLTKHLEGYSVAKGFGVAVANESGTVSFYPNRKKNSGSGSRYISRGRGEPISVNAISFKKALSVEPRVVKIDIEGGEYDLDFGLLPDSVEVLATELHFGRKKWREIEAPALITKIQEKGFVTTNPTVKMKHRHQVNIWTRK